MITVGTDLRPLFGPVRDQGSRPTCLAFAASDAHAGLRPDWTELSCEYAFYHAQMLSGRSPSQGATLRSMLDTLRDRGQPAEKDWPYLASLPSDPAVWLPPAGVGACFKRNGRMSADPVNAVIAQLDRKNPVLLLATLSPSFFMPTPDGIVAPKQGEQPDPALRHAVVAVGHGEIEGAPAILVRNSWGSAWGIGGHAWLTDSFLAPRLFATVILLEEIDVSPNPATT